WHRFDLKQPCRFVIDQRDPHLDFGSDHLVRPLTVRPFHSASPVERCTYALVRTTHESCLRGTDLLELQTQGGLDCWSNEFLGRGHLEYVDSVWNHGSMICGAPRGTPYKNGRGRQMVRDLDIDARERRSEGERETCTCHLVDSLPGMRPAPRIRPWSWPLRRRGSLR